MTRLKRTLITLSLGFMLLSPIAHADDRGPRVARVLWQDRDRDTLMWGEVHGGEKWIVSASPVKDFPKLDVEKQDLAQMKQAKGHLLVGVRDNDDGKFQSGWVAVDTGVREEPHGNHSHWNFVSSPTVKSSRLDADQGNPAHLYLYNDHFYMANDRKNGFTHIDPKDLIAKPAKLRNLLYRRRQSHHDGGRGQHRVLLDVE